MIDRKWLGHELPSQEFPIERSRLRFFAKAIGETNPIYLDVEAARAAGYPDLPAPPTFLLSAEASADVKIRWFTDAGLPLGKMLHGEQSFTHHLPVCAGDTVRATTRVAELFDKKDGTLEFIVLATDVVNQRAEKVAESRCVLVVRHG
jgi:acyl dehydratase